MTNPMQNNSPSSCPDANSGSALIAAGQALNMPPAPPVPAHNSCPTPTSLSTDLLYKGAALYKRAMARIGKVKCQPSAMRVTACGEGDTSGLKTLPWQINGPTVWDNVQTHIDKGTPKKQV